MTSTLLMVTSHECDGKNIGHCKVYKPYKERRRQQAKCGPWVIGSDQIRLPKIYLEAGSACELAVS
ncbi:hypothetical protein CH63R_14120 [Colletotrichum higginsianum IMI 349063]|uniref:Uncharacterized protein n=1 Tax=Colletotrichum higginsianum (strain IMI 349063) TaxID=759273 RepID=A0A1B7XT37_COLHI|nr:hypothetical protein CH63R_14120 [Colletotrichum higginsianum IMI 349063]OBR02894.1 hypothetical protein CH63R_14120 [Colletotrichum higginsianum IMI 349063]GJD00860.1 hypothetical protein ColKHC_09685 [Colletotrichum higginsianum]